MIIDTDRLCAFGVIVLILIFATAVIITMDRVFQNRTIAEWKEKGAIIQINGTVIDVNTIREYQYGGAGITLVFKNGDEIYSSVFTITTTAAVEQKNDNF